MPHFPLRPVVIVIALLAASTLACSISVSQARFEDAKLYKTPAGEDSTRSFQPDDTVYCILTVKDVDGELPLRVVWLRRQEDDDETVTRTEIAQDERAVSNGPVTFELTPPADGWPRGSYQADLYLDDNHKQTLPFSIK